MHRRLLLAAVASLALSACDSSEASQPIVQIKPEPTLKDVDPQAYHQNIQAAMAEIPREEMARFQELFLCEMRRNNRLPEPKPVTAEYVRALNAYIKANPTAADTCDA